MNIRGFIANKEEYEKGNLVGKWVEFPISKEELEEELEEIGVNSECSDEYFFKHWDSVDFEASEVLNEYEDIEFLNAMANMDYDDVLQMYYEESPDDTIYYMDDLEWILEGYSTIDVICKVFYGKFNPNDDCFTFNGYANLESMNETEKNRLEEMYFEDCIHTIRGRY